MVAGHPGVTPSVSSRAANPVYRRFTLDTPNLSVELTKLRRPRVGSGLVTREALVARLDAGLRVPVLLVTAPTGFGKTWLVADWLDTHPDTAQGWVTLDAFDNDPMRLWLHVATAIENSGCPEAATEALRVLESTGAGVSVVVDALAGSLANADVDFILVLDNVQLLEHPDVLASLDQFLELLGPKTDVVLMGRHDPAVPLTKWRLADQAIEIRTSDLRFSLEEGRILVTDKMGLDLPDDVLAEIMGKTMGWIAGIRLAAQTVTASQDAARSAGQLPAVGSIAGAYATIGEYLIDEALDDLSGDDRRFVLETSILDDLTPSLCDHVSERADSQDILERLTRAGLFINRTSTGASASYRYHDLLRSALNALLRSRHPDRAHHLHHRAAQWNHAHGHAIRRHTPRPRCRPTQSRRMVAHRSRARDAHVQAKRDFERSLQSTRRRHRHPVARRPHDLVLPAAVLRRSRR